ncbi:hypothetical protein N7495_007258 [Penicillium taxi]|uniref:uncharacterized protein n=1 Tax=Penicillium taxi TaxID=168475 RepID=UPI002545A747|nr:uncharacterized protein N7495_007258 [Penicillium taxi]KAJ5895567.1 hypothetical protein N7495_007258 [Penicillium taxi]
MTDPFPRGGARAPTYGFSGPRRYSYASVVSGNTLVSPTSTSTSLAHLLNHQPPSPPQLDSRLLYRTQSGLDAPDMHPNSTMRSTSIQDPLPHYSRMYAGNYYQTDSSGPLHPSYLDPSYFTPSYLLNSRYISRRDAAHRARILNAEVLEASSSHSTLNPPISAQLNGHHPHVSTTHRGMTYDIIEKEVSTTTDQVLPLPTQWSSTDKYGALEVSNHGTEVRYSGPTDKHDHEAASLRTNNPMPPQCGIYYYEITIESKPKDGMIAIGFSNSKASVERLPGWEQESWGYHGDDGKSFFGEVQGQGRNYGPTFGLGDIVGCGVNFSNGTGFFTKNGVFLGEMSFLKTTTRADQAEGPGIAFHDLRNVKLYPSVGMKKQRIVALKTNFGQEPFLFDIDGMVNKKKYKVHAQINATSADSLQPGLSESGLLQELVAQYLAHEGYDKAAREFATEIATENAALNDGYTKPVNPSGLKKDLADINRNKIRSAILDGNIDQALKSTKAYFPKVLGSHPKIHFHLRCRKFLEMMRRANDLSPEKHSVTASNQPQSTSPEVFDQEMELDGDGDGDGWEGMDTEESDTRSQFNEAMAEVLKYGQKLQLDYPSDENGGDKKFLKAIFSLVAYPDPEKSMHGHHLSSKGRTLVAEELNSAILVSLGRSSTSALERLYKQTEALVNEISEDGGAGSFIDTRAYSSL